MKKEQCEVELFLNGKTRLIPSVHFVPNLNKNVLSYDQLFDQGFDVIFQGDHCDIKNMFENDEESNNCKVNLDKVNLGKDDWKPSCLDPEAWVTFLDTLHIPNYVESSKEYLWGEFARFVKWFYKEHFNQKDKKYPPTLPNGCDIELLDLYMFVENEGGYEKASRNCKWGEIAIKMGFKESNAVNLMITYQGYLDLMTWRYHIAKEDENKVGEPSCSYLMDEDVGKGFKVNEEEVAVNAVQNVAVNAVQNDENVAVNAVQNDENVAVNDVQNDEKVAVNAVQNEENVAVNVVHNEEKDVTVFVQKEEQPVTTAMESEDANEEFEDVDLCLEDYDDIEDFILLDENIDAAAD
ncbi:hypothetical protein R6Q57_018688 [Mikania cordata]